jgi:hypothetical protein
MDNSQMLAECRAALQAGTNTPVEVGLPLENVYIGGHPHVVWPIYHEDRRQEPDFAGVGIAVCILPRENDTPAERRSMEANARIIAALLNAAHSQLDDIATWLAKADEFRRKSRMVGTVYREQYECLAGTYTSVAATALTRLHAALCGGGE